MQKNNHKNSAPPDLIRGIVTTVVLVIASLFAATWFIINSQVESLIEQRTSEYAHSIARIAADSSSEALLSEDILQLNLLVENVAKDPHIRQATIYSEDGIIVSQYPAEIVELSKDELRTKAQEEVRKEILEKNESSSETKSDVNSVSREFILRQKNIPFIEPITYQNITAGWFKLEIESHLLEKKFRDAFRSIQVLSGSIAVVLFVLLLLVLFRLESSVKTVAMNCHHLLLQNRIIPSRKKTEWIDSLSKLANEHPQQLKEHLVMPAPHAHWSQSSLRTDVLVCVFDFNLQVEQCDDLAESLTIAEDYLSKAAQAYGVQSQGDILTGCIVPFLDSSGSPDNDASNQINDALCFIELLKKLISKIPIQLQMKSCLIRTSVLLLEDEHDLVTGVCLVNDSSIAIKKIFININYDQTLSLFIDEDELTNIAEFEVADIENDSNYNILRLKQIAPELTQQISRKVNYISNH